MKTPRTQSEWQEAVNLAAGLRMLADMKMYGLLEGGPTIHIERCDNLLKRGKKRGVTPNQSATDLAILIFAEIKSEEEARGKGVGANAVSL